MLKTNLNKGGYPVKLSEKSTYVSPMKLLVKNSEGKYLV